MAERSKAGRPFRFCVDRGGTFTDIYAEVPAEPGCRTLKLLSVNPDHYENAPLEGIRQILEEVTGVEIPRSLKVPTDQIDWIRMGTTVATNALLERKGERTALAVTKGFRDILQIGSQARPKIFDLTVQKPSLIYERVIEVNERVQLADADLIHDVEAGRSISQRLVKGQSGEWFEVVRSIDTEALKEPLQRLLDDGITSLAVVLLHSYSFVDHELAVKDLAIQMGFKQVSASAALIPMVKMVPRGLTASVDAYLTPGIQENMANFLAGFDEGLDNVNISLMQSDGGLTPASRFTGFKAVLSGPAGGVVGYAMTTFRVETDQPVIGFDMGGTSTDVSRYDGNYEQVFETHTAGVAIQAPQLDINTVAAGGGSKLQFQAGVFRVGPESVGAHPGPVCYRKGGQLAVTDANLLLGRVLPAYFPKIFGPNENEPLDVEGTRKAFTELTRSINSAVRAYDPNAAEMSEEEVALGFIDVANEAMCRPIRQLTEMKGYDTSVHTLACFGGAGPQHACAIARALKMSKVLVHRYCGILSAYGMGLADVMTDALEPCALTYSIEAMGEVHCRAKVLRKRVIDELHEQGFKDKDIETQLLLNLRYQGTDTAIMVGPLDASDNGDYLKAFVKQFRREYGFELRGRVVLIDDIRIRGIGRTNILKPLLVDKACEPAQPEGIEERVYFQGGWRQTPVYLLERLRYGHKLVGPVIIMNGNSTILVEPGCTATITKYGNVIIENDSKSVVGNRGTTVSANDIVVQNAELGREILTQEMPIGTELDLVQLSIFNNRFMGIAEQMGRTLQRTSISTNIKERLDFSCAIFSPDGGLVANAPHVPVHLGAMSSTIRWQIAYWGNNLRDGDVLVTNHPTAGGSHLPDITVITPVFNEGKLVFFVASRGHHAEIGGITPGSMPPFSKFLSEEGVAIKAFKIVENGIFQEEAISALLLSPHYEKDNECPVGSKARVIPGTRKIEDNISDLRAQVAANQRGITLIGELINYYGLDVVQAYMHHVQVNAEQAVQDMLRGIVDKVLKERGGKDGSMENIVVKGEECRNGGKERGNDTAVVLEAEDFMDDGARICLKLTVDKKGKAEFDFSGTSPEVYGNWNAPEAVVAAAIIYSLRCLVDVDIPLNQGCLAPVAIKIPPGCFLSPSDNAAVVGGNVVTSQRVTDVVLTAFQACACSQGCMNNLTFGDDSFGYYETIGGGSGAGPTWDGASGVQCHMTNTRITDPEILERRYPVLLHQFGLRENSGGAGKHRGGDGIIRDIEFRRPMMASVLSERRVLAPRGMAGGMDGARGENMLVRNNGKRIYLGGKNSVVIAKGDRICIKTPGGGGWGTPVQQEKTSPKCH